MSHQLKGFNLRLEDVFLRLVLIPCLVHHVWPHHSTSHHRISTHASCSRWSCFFGWLVFLLFFHRIFFKEKIIDLSESKHDKEVKRSSWNITDIEVFKINSWLSHWPELLCKWEGNFGREESCEEWVDPHHGRNGGTHHHEISLHTIHHSWLHVCHVVGHIIWLSGAFLFQISFRRFTQETSSGIKGISGQEGTSLDKFVTFGNKLLIFVLNKLAFGCDVFFILGLELIISHVVTEDTDKESNVDDGEKYPEDETFVEEKVRHNDRPWSCLLI